MWKTEDRIQENLKLLEVTFNIAERSIFFQFILNIIWGNLITIYDLVIEKSM